MGIDTGPRTKGNGYSAAQPKRTVAKPKGILKNGAPAAKAAVPKAAPRTAAKAPNFQGKAYQNFSNKLAGQKGAIETLKKGQATQTKRINAKTAQVRPQVEKATKANRAALQNKGDAARLKRKKPVLKKAALGPTKAKAKVLSKASKGKKGLKVAKAAKGLKTARNLGKLATGGVGVMAAEALLGEDIPDVVDVATWTVDTLKDPKNAGKRFTELGKNTAAAGVRIAKTLTDPKKMGKNLGNAGKNIGKGAKKAGKAIGKGAKKAGCALVSVFNPKGKKKC
ncbi:MAG: hypothetical protein KDE22_17145 [Rhodobacterales bacterium]|nr:hypothetical protein [Rhodobacterales bacterium]